MKSVPRIALWLLKHFGSGPDNDAIIGDLAERYSQEGSRLWYWRQVIVAIVRGVARESREHIFLTVRALLAGWMVVSLFHASFNFLLRDQLFGLETWSRSWRASWILPLAWTLYGVVFFTICGWLIARLRRPVEFQLLFSEWRPEGLNKVSMVLIFTVAVCCVTWTESLLVMIRQTRYLAEGVKWWPAFVLPVLVPISILFGAGVFNSAPSKSRLA